MPPVRRRQDYGLWLALLRRCPTPTPCPRCSPTTGCGRPRSRAASSAPPRRPGRSTARSRAWSRPRAGLVPRPQPRPRGAEAGRVAGRSPGLVSRAGRPARSARPREAAGVLQPRRRGARRGAARPKTREKTRARARAWASPSQTKPELSCGCTLTGSGSCTPAEPGGEAVGEEDVLLAEHGRGAGADAEALVEAHAARRAPRASRSAISWLEARAAFSRVSRRRGRGRLRGRPSGSSERPTKRSSPGFAAKKRRMPAQAPGGWTTSSSATSRISPRASVERGVAAAREPGGGEPHHRHVGPGREPVERRAEPRVGVRLLHQHQPVDARARPARRAASSPSARAPRVETATVRLGSSGPTPRGLRPPQPGEGREVPLVARGERRGESPAAAARSGWRRSGGRARRAC